MREARFYCSVLEREDGSMAEAKAIQTPCHIYTAAGHVQNCQSTVFPAKTPTVLPQGSFGPCPSPAHACTGTSGPKCCQRWAASSPSRSHALATIMLDPVCFRSWACDMPVPLIYWFGFACITPLTCPGTTDSSAVRTAPSTIRKTAL